MKVKYKKKELKRYQKENIKSFIIRISVFISICIILLCSLFFSNFFEKYINHLYFNFNNDISSSQCKVHFINVGQGDCTFVQLPDGKNLMIDTGPENSLDNVERYLNVLGIKHKDKIDYLILTHTDSDHIGNACKIIKNYNILFHLFSHLSRSAHYAFVCSSYTYLDNRKRCFVSRKM